jgi:hypothetical protein
VAAAGIAALVVVFVAGRSPRRISFVPAHLLPGEGIIRKRRKSKRYKQRDWFKKPTQIVMIAVVQSGVNPNFGHYTSSEHQGVSD